MDSFQGFYYHQMRDFVKPDATVAERIKTLSILIVRFRITLLQLRKTMLLIRELSLTIPSYKDLQDVETELMSRCTEIEHSLRILMEPILQNIDFGHNRLNHWGVSTEDIRLGYCKLEEVIAYDIYDKPIRFGRKFIVLLNDFTDPTLGKFYSGELIPWSVASNFIDDIPESKGKMKGLYDAVIGSIELASRYRAKKHLLHDKETS